MDLNRQGTVVGLTGANEDGETLLEGYDGKGKDKITVADELIDRAIEMGFLSEGGPGFPSPSIPRTKPCSKSMGRAAHQSNRAFDGRITVTIEIMNHQDGQVRKARKTVHLRLPLGRALSAGANLAFLVRAVSPRGCASDLFQRHRL